MRAILETYHQQGLVRKSSHPELPLDLYVYSMHTEVNEKWDEVTMRCRGLVIDNQGSIVTNPMPKFFNLEQVDAIPDGDFLAYEKLDGSLINVALYKGKLIVSSKGSFVSDQAKEAEAMLSHLVDKFDSRYTYVFEILYPENRIVVDYGDRKELILLAIRETATGKERPDLLQSYAESLGFRAATIYYFPTIEHLKEEKQRTDWTNQEGYVLLFENGERIKVKYEQYFLLHKIRTDLSDKAIIEALRDGKDLVQIYAESMIPDEFLNELKKRVGFWAAEFWKVRGEVEDAHRAILANFSGQTFVAQKAFAREVMKAPKDLQGLIFLLNVHNTEKLNAGVWKLLLKREKESRKDG